MNRLFRRVCGVFCVVILLAVHTACAENPCLTVLTYNIHHGEGTDGKLDLERIADVINSVTPDLVALQEVDVKTTRVEGIDEAAELSRLTGMTAHFFPAIPYAGGQYGIGVLVRSSRFVEQHRFVKNMPCTPGWEDRVVFELILNLKNAEYKNPLIRFYGAHLDYHQDERDRLPSARLINEWACKDAVRWLGTEKLAFDVNAPSILAGDLNAEPDSNTIQELKKCWTASGDRRNQLTWPSHNPDRRIDYIMFRPHNRWRVIETRVLDEKVASDHLPFLAILELLPEEK
ncbi:MAG: endonuclease/exonuclease/phosphatase family protein [Candidatus Omnitrophica bacterium]|nr:endonuclease/exonuclease/phosphatase family protein [Candidatus Omnitrophota bacterium]